MCNGENERCKVASHLSRANTLTEDRAGGEEGDGGGEEEGALEEEEEDDSGDNKEDDGMNG